MAYDSDVAISQLNASTGLGDAVGGIGVSASYKLVHTPSHSLSVGYDFSQSLHAKLSPYDIQSHGAAVSGSVSLHKTTLGLSYSFNHLLLGGRPFLDLHFVSPSIFRPITPRLYARASFTYLAERFPIDRRRDATHIQPGLQLFYFFDHSRSFVLLGASDQHEQAADPQFSYKGLTLSASLTKAVRVVGVNAKLKAEYERVKRDYEAPTPSIGANRFDRVSNYRLSADIPLIKRLSLVVEGRYIGRKSNVQYANLDETIGMTELVFRL